MSPPATFPASLDLELEGHLARSTRDSYEWYMRKVVLPAFKDLTLREIGVARCDTGSSSSWPR